MRRFDRQEEQAVATRVEALGTIRSVLDTLRGYDARDEAIEWLEQDVARQRAACAEELRGTLSSVVRPSA